MQPTHSKFYTTQAKRFYRLSACLVPCCSRVQLQRRSNNGARMFGWCIISFWLMTCKICSSARLRGNVTSGNVTRKHLAACRSAGCRAHTAWLNTYNNQSDSIFWSSPAAPSIYISFSVFLLTILNEIRFYQHFFSEWHRCSHCKPEEGDGAVNNCIVNPLQI